MIELQGITKSFGTLQVLKGIDLMIEKGEVVSIVGPSGAGKTTLLQIMGTLDKADTGTILLNGTEVSCLKEKELSAFRNRQIGFVFQFHQCFRECDDACVDSRYIFFRSYAESQRNASFFGLVRTCFAQTG